MCERERCWYIGSVHSGCTISEVEQLTVRASESEGNKRGTKIEHDREGWIKKKNIKTKKDEEKHTNWVYVSGLFGQRRT